MSDGLHSSVWGWVFVCAKLSFSRTIKCSFTVHLFHTSVPYRFYQHALTHFLKRVLTSHAQLLQFCSSASSASVKNHSGNVLVTICDPEGAQGPAAHGLTSLHHINVYKWINIEKSSPVLQNNKTSLTIKQNN